MPHRDTHPDHRNELLEGYKQPFDQNQHAAKYLRSELTYVAKLRSNRNPKAFTRLQKLALDRFQYENVFNIFEAREGPEEILRAYFEIFDEFFFFASLGERCSMILARVDNSMPHYCTEGRTDDWVESDGTKKIQIVIFWKDDTDSNTQAIWNSLGLLLHLMIDAFFKLWMCDEVVCCRHWQRGGMTGHGHDWMHASGEVLAAVEDITTFGLPLKIHRARACGYEIWKSGHELLPFMDLKHEYDVENKYVRQWHKEYAKIAGEKKPERGKKKKEPKGRSSSL